MPILWVHAEGRSHAASPDAPNAVLKGFDRQAADEHLHGGAKLPRHVRCDVHRFRVSDIAARLARTPSAVSRAVARMRALGILRPGTTREGQPAGLRISRRVLFRGNAFHYCELAQDPPLFDPDEAPIIQRMRRRPLLASARGALVATRRGARSGSGSRSGGGHERDARSRDRWNSRATSTGIIRTC